jgi:hypothetical protein
MTNGSGEKTNGVVVGQKIYPNPGPSTEWQLLLLSRSNLSMVANEHYNITPSTEFAYGPLDKLIADITPGGSLIKRCGSPGCLMILQGPVNHASFSPFPCGPGTVQPDDIIECSRLKDALTSIGATLTSTYLTPDTPGSSGAGYSFIGNVGSKKLSTGVNFERITCSNSDGCLSVPVVGHTNNDSAFIDGIAPNGVDGVVPDLRDTANDGTTSIPATFDAPAMTIYNNGAAGGLLVADNQNNYTFTWAAPPVRFQMGTTPDHPNKHVLILQIPAASKMRFPNGRTTLEEDSAQMPADQIGGFHLVILNAITLEPLVNSTYVTNPIHCPGTCSSPDGTTIHSLDELPAELMRFRSRGNLWFLGSFGSLSHDFPATVTVPGYAMQDVWDRVAQSVQDLGGTYATFAMLDNPALAQNDYDQYSKDKVPTDDDYNMVGQLWINASGVPNPYAVETSRAISRQTSLQPVAGNMQGVLKKGRDGFYAAAQYSQYEGVLPLPAFDFATASYLPRVAWPLTGSNDPIGPKRAYEWISEQLLHCVSCSDIRSAYTNLLQTPSLWYAALSNLQPPADCSGTKNPCEFTNNDFATAKLQLLTEFEDLTALRTLQNSMVISATAKAPDFNSLLTAVGDNVLANIPYSTTLHTGPNLTNDILNVVGDASGFAGMIPEVGAGISASVRTGIGLYELGTDDGTTMNDANGRSLIQQEKDFTEIAQLANQRANQYADSITAIGVTFSRIVSDWGRMQAAAAPILDNTLQFDDQALGQYLTGYNLSVRRSLYTALMPLNYYAVHYRYSDPGLNHLTYGIEPDWFSDLIFLTPCFTPKKLPDLLKNNPGSFGFWEGALIDGPGASLQTSTSGNGHAYPFDAWWDLWFVGQKQDYDTYISQTGSLEKFPGCPANQPDKYLPSADFFKATELFTPLGTDANALGFYKPWFLGRGPLTRLRAVGTSTDFWRSEQSHGHPRINSSDWAPDPDNY